MGMSNLCSDRACTSTASSKQTLFPTNHNSPLLHQPPRTTHHTLRLHIRRYRPEMQNPEVAAEPVGVRVRGPQMNINAYTSRPRLLLYQTIVSVTPQEVQQRDLAPAERFEVWLRESS